MKRKVRSTARKPGLSRRKKRPQTPGSARSRRGVGNRKTAPGSEASRIKPRTAGAPSRKLQCVLSAREKRKLRELLAVTRERIVGQVTALQHDSLRRFDEVNTEEDGTDAFERQFALNLAGTEENALFQIDEALRRLDEGIYGICEACRKPIEKARLRALPFVSMCLRCQTETEKGTGMLKPSYPTIAPAEADAGNASLPSDEE